MLRIPYTLASLIALNRRSPPMHPTAAASPPKTPGQSPSGAAAPRPAAVKSEALFDGASEVLIDHRGVMYRLRLTSLGKLILTK